MKTIYLQKKRSGNIVINDYLNECQELKAICLNPLELKKELLKTPNERIIIAEYRLSQNKTRCVFVSDKQILKIFGIKQTQENLKQFFK